MLIMFNVRVYVLLSVLNLTWICTTGTNGPNCDNNEFTEVLVGTKTIYLSTQYLPFTWFEAFCCCRSRRQNLISLEVQQDFKNLYVALPFDKYHLLGWTDVYGYGGGLMKSVVSGNVPRKDVYHNPNEYPSDGTCAEITPNVAHTTYSLFFLECTRTHTEQVLCEGNYKSTVLQLDDCFSTGKGCNKENVTKYIREKSCPEDGTSTEVPTAEFAGCSNPCCNCPWWTRYIG